MKNARLRSASASVCGSFPAVDARMRKGIAAAALATSSLTSAPAFASCRSWILATRAAVAADVVALA